MTAVKFALKWPIHGQYVDTDYRDLERVAVAADQVGFDAIFVVDHLFLPADGLKSNSPADPHKPYSLEAYTALAAIAAVTKQARIGPQVTPVSLRHPVFIAKMATTIDHISNGRFILQLGTGWHRAEYENYGFEWDERFSVRYDKMVEGLEVIKKLWTAEEPVTHAGKYYRLQNAPFWPKPVQKPHPQIWFGGTGKKIRAAIAKYGNAWAPAMPQRGGIGPQAYAEILAEIRALAQAEGRRPDEILAGALFYTSIDEDRSRALERAAIVLQREAWSKLTMAEVQQAGTAIAGTPDDCIQGLERFVEAGVRHFTLTFPPFTDLKGIVGQLSLYSQKIFPHFT